MAELPNYSSLLVLLDPRVLLLVVLGWLGFKVWRAVTSAHRDIPGPFAARFTNLWLFGQILKGDFHKTNIELHRKFGPIIRIAPNEYSIDSVEAAKTIYGHGTHFTKSSWYKGHGDPSPKAFDLFTDADIARHAVTRRKYSQAYSMTSILQYEQFVDNCTAILEQRFVDFVKAGECVDLGHWLQCYAFDVIGEITFAERFGFLDKGEDVGYLMSTLWDSEKVFNAPVGVYPSLYRPACKLLGLIADAKKDGRAYIVNFTMSKIAQRKGADIGNRPPDFLTKFLKSNDDDSTKFPESSIKVGCVQNVGAGSDTTGISLNTVMYHLGRNPEILRNLREEIDLAAMEGRISDPVTFSEAQKLPYLQAVLKEALRIHPAVGLLMERVVPPGGATIEGRYFSAGTVVGINSWVAHQNTSIFGPDASIFRPERWLGSEDSQHAQDRYFMAFGMGSRTCIGKNVSLMEMSKLVPQLVRRFDFQIEGDWKIHNAWFVKQTDFKCFITKRKAEQE